MPALCVIASRTSAFPLRYHPHYGIAMKRMLRASISILLADLLPPQAGLPQYCIGMAAAAESVMRFAAKPPLAIKNIWIGFLLATSPH